MNSSFLTADRATHSRVLLTAGLGALLVVSIALGAQHLIQQEVVFDHAPAQGQTQGLTQGQTRRVSPPVVAPAPGRPALTRAFA